MSGDFTDSGLVDDVTGLSPTEMLSLQDWLIFYKREYIYKGKSSERKVDKKTNVGEIVMSVRKM